MNSTDKIRLHCTDNDQYVDAYILARRDKSFIEVAVNTVKVHLAYRKGKNNNPGMYVGAMAGMEFVIPETAVPEEWETNNIRRIR